MGSEVATHVDNVQTSADYEQQSREATKLNKHVVNKLVHAHTKRLLRILGYQSTEQDRKRLEYGIKQHGYVKVTQDEQPECDKSTNFSDYYSQVHQFHSQLIDLVDKATEDIRKE